MSVLGALFVLLVASASAVPTAQATFPGRNGALLVHGATADFFGICTQTHRPRPIGRVADSDDCAESKNESPPPWALFLFGPWPQRLRQFIHAPTNIRKREPGPR